MYTAFLLLHVIVAISLIVLVLIQQGRGAEAGAAFGSGASSTVFGSRGSASFLTRITAGLATAFFVLSLILAYFATQTTSVSSIVGSSETIEAPAAVETGPADVPTGDSAADSSATEGAENAQSAADDAATAAGSEGSEQASDVPQLPQPTEDSTDSQ